MTLPRSKSRPIRVRNVDYRWALTRSGQTGHMLIVERFRGASLAIRLWREIEGEFWLCDGTKAYVSALSSGPVGRLVELALADDWDPESTGRTWFEIDGDSLVRI